MMKRDSDALDITMDQFAHDAVITLSKRRLRHLYGLERLGKNAWRDLFARLPEGVEVADIRVIEQGDDVILVKASSAQSAEKYV